MDWKTVDLNQLRAILDSGATAATVGQVFGVTRNSAIGGIRRLVRSGALSHGFAKKGPPPVVERMRRRAKPRTNGHKIEIAPPQRQPMSLAKFDANQVGCPLKDLKPNQCRWPVSGHDVSPILFCEGTQFNGSYCTTHAHYNKRPWKERANGVTYQTKPRYR